MALTRGTALLHRVCGVLIGPFGPPRVSTVSLCVRPCGVGAARGGYAVRRVREGGRWPGRWRSQNRTNSRLNYIAIIAEPSRRVWHSDGDAVTLTGPAGRSRGRRDRRTRPGAAKLNAHSALRHGPGAACAPRRRSAQLPQWRNWRIAPSMRAGADEYEFAIRNCRVTFAYVDDVRTRARRAERTGVWPSCGELFVETVPGFLYRYRVPS